MNLHQFRVLSAVLRLPAQFTTPDLVREAGVSAEVVRKTYQRYEPFFTIVADTKPKVRSLTPRGRDEITRELRETRSHLPPPPVTRGPEGEPLGLAAAERILYELVPAADAEGRAVLLREARSHLELADQECELSDEPGPRISVEVRLDAMRRMLGSVEVLHSAQDALTLGVPRNDFSSVGALATALINSAAAQEFSQRPTSTPVCAGLLTLKSIQARAPAEADQIALALRGLAREPAWRKALGHPGVFWTSNEEAILEAPLKDSTGGRGGDPARGRGSNLGTNFWAVQNYSFESYQVRSSHGFSIFGEDPGAPVSTNSGCARIRLAAQPLPLLAKRPSLGMVNYRSYGDAVRGFGDAVRGQDIEQNLGVIRAFDLNLMDQKIVGAVLALEHHRDQPRWVPYRELLPHENGFSYNDLIRPNQLRAPSTLPSPSKPPWPSKDGLCLLLSSGIVQIRLDPGYFINVLDDQLDLPHVGLVGEDIKVGEVWWLDFNAITGQLIDVHMQQQVSGSLIKIPSGDLAYNPDRECFIIHALPRTPVGFFTPSRVTRHRSHGTSSNNRPH